MANEEVTLMKGNEAIAHACIRCGADGFFGYPITPQSEIIETLALLKLGKLPVWWCYRLRAKWQPSIWCMVVRALASVSSQPRQALVWL